MLTAINKNSVTLFEMTGKDVITFLNNQVLSELEESIDPLQFTAICNPKGRIVFTLLIHQSDNTIFVAVDSSLSDNFLQYVNMRRFRMDLCIEKSTYQLAFDAQQNGPGLALFEFNKSVDLTAADIDQFWLLMFELGLPWITIETSEQYIPQHLNLDQNEVIDFNKGCYPGQEIVARLHFLGKVKKRMKYIQYRSDEAFGINDKIRLPEYDSSLIICSPSVYHQDKWHAQAISAI